MNEQLIRDMIDALDTADHDIFSAYKALEMAKDSGIHVNLAAQKKELRALCSELSDLSGFYERELADRLNGNND